ncbi:hypothetical protein [Marinobacter sp. X15-166B]|uniref:hypothetical protein n=1 Tax=Marinobacter sp. X15-166B TaxID=1897620 RepID=UPI00085C0C2E|nr:hypothetical protein [Marinobacter sp. X15-166B]OEY67836.1 hypothetical protein BG841_16330 [Marinobacter sp. X15-166B]
MFWNFVATLCAGLGGAGIALTLRASTRKKAPRWTIPVFAGLGMLGYLIYGEYTWFAHKQTQLPPEAVVVASDSEPVLWRPWSFLVPQVSRFTVLDTNSIDRDGATPAVRRFYLYRFEQSYADQVSGQIHLLNCDIRQLVPLADDGQANLRAMRTLTPEDRLYTRVCN